MWCYVPVSACLLLAFSFHPHHGFSFMNRVIGFHLMCPPQVHCSRHSINDENLTLLLVCLQKWTCSNIALFLSSLWLKPLFFFCFFFTPQKPQSPIWGDCDTGVVWSSMDQKGVVRFQSSAAYMSKYPWTNTKPQISSDTLSSNVND